jgi:hypothetical protein
MVWADRKRSVCCAHLDFHRTSSIERRGTKSIDFAKPLQYFFSLNELLYDFISSHSEEEEMFAFMVDRALSMKNQKKKRYLFLAISFTS